MKRIRLNYWKDHHNFGDILTPIILKRIFGISSKWVDLEDANFIGIGSYLEALPVTYNGYIWGAGQMFEQSEIHLPEAKYLAVRGYLTKQLSLIDCDVVGDPGLFVKELLTEKVEKTHEIGTIPHWNDSVLMGDFVIDITGDVDEIIKQVASCERIVTTSLHGVILADALNIPRIWHKTEANPGDGFKFRDYQSIYGDIVYPGEIYQASQEIVDVTIKRLSKAIKNI